MLILLVVAILFAIASSIAGNSKGMAGSGFALGLLLGPIGLIIVLVSHGTRVQCPSCREYVMADARKCRFCGTEFTAPLATQLAGPTITCPKCSTVYEADRTGCTHCGAAKPKAVAAT